MIIQERFHRVAFLLAFYLSLILCISLISYFWLHGFLHPFWFFFFLQITFVYCFSFCLHFFILNFPSLILQSLPIFYIFLSKSSCVLHVSWLFFYLSVTPAMVVRVLISYISSMILLLDIDVFSGVWTLLLKPYFSLHVSQPKNTILLDSGLPYLCHPEPRGNPLSLIQRKGLPSIVMEMQTV